MSAETVPKSESEPELLSAERVSQPSDVISHQLESSKPETWDTVKDETEKDINSPESPKSLFSQAYEKVRNTEVVSNIVDHVSIWFKGRHIDAMHSDIARLEGLKAAQ